MFDFLEKVIGLVLFGLVLHTAILVIGRNSIGWLRLVDRRLRGWLIVLFILTILLLVAAHLVSR